jgi:hypothetical protein
VNNSQSLLAFSISVSGIAGLFFGAATGHWRRERAIKAAAKAAYDEGRNRGRSEGYSLGLFDATRRLGNALSTPAPKPADAQTAVMSVVPSGHTAILPRQVDDTAAYARPPIQRSWGQRSRNHNKEN